MLLMAWATRIKQQLFVFDTLLQPVIWKDYEAPKTPEMTSCWYIRQGHCIGIHIVGFWKGDIDFLIVFHSNFDSITYRLRDKEVFKNRKWRHADIFLPGTICGLYFQILKGRPWLPINVTLTCFAYLQPFEFVISAVISLLVPKSYWFWEKMTLKTENVEKHWLRGHFLESGRVFWATVRKERLADFGCTRRKETNTTKLKPITLIPHIFFVFFFYSPSSIDTGWFHFVTYNVTFIIFVTESRVLSTELQFFQTIRCSCTARKCGIKYKTPWSSSVLVARWAGLNVGVVSIMLRNSWENAFMLLYLHNKASSDQNKIIYEINK